MKVYKSNNSKVNLCDDCELDFPTCPKAPIIEFGDGRGNDNIITCSEYKGPEIEGMTCEESE